MGVGGGPLRASARLVSGDFTPLTLVGEAERSIHFARGPSSHGAPWGHARGRRGSGHDRDDCIRATPAQGRAARAHRRDARAGTGVRIGGSQHGRTAVRRRGRTPPRLQLRGPAVVPRHLLRATARCSGPNRTSTTSRTPICPGQPVRACVTPRSSSTRRRTPERGVAFETCCMGISRALVDGAAELGISSGLILCFLRDLSEDAALKTLEEARPFAEHLLAVGLDSAEVGNPPGNFARVFRQAREMGLPGRRACRRGGPARVHLGGAGRAEGAAHRSRCAVPGGRPPRGEAGGGADPAHRVPLLQCEAAGLSHLCSSTTFRRWCGAAFS